MGDGAIEEENADTNYQRALTGEFSGTVVTMTGPFNF